MRIFRCYDCGWGLHTDASVENNCHHCGGNRWTQLTSIGPLDAWRVFFQSNHQVFPVSENSFFLNRWAARVMEKYFSGRRTHGEREEGSCT